MSTDSPEALLLLATEAALAAGGLIRANFGFEPVVASQEAHDIKIELDRRSQDLIENLLLARFPEYAIYGEEGVRGAADSENQWIIDPIDGTVNFFYGIPHFCVSIALRRAGEIIVGVIYDPMRDELWTVLKGGPALLNGRPIRVSQRSALAEATITVGFSKTAASIEKGLPTFERMVRSAKKCRMMGSAALDVAYVATGRLDAYIESQISLWDIGAGVLLVEAAGGSVQLEPHATVPDKYSAVITNGCLDLGL
jgi:myo-inositol-1(or 4)-monophosphatase